MGVLSRACASAVGAIIFCLPAAAVASVVITGAPVTIYDTPGQDGPCRAWSTQCYRIANAGFYLTSETDLVDRTWNGKGDWAALFFDFRHSGDNDFDQKFFAGFMYEGITYEGEFTAYAGDPTFHIVAFGFSVRDLGTGPITAFIRSEDDFGPVIDRFSLQIQAVPEPGTWALLIAGFSLTGLALRRQLAVRRATPRAASLHSKLGGRREHSPSER